MVDDITEKEYLSFMVNRSLSYFPDTVLFANEVNVYHNIDNRMQYDFLREAIRKRKRFSKWNKQTKSKPLEIVKAYYGYSTIEAKRVMSLLNKDQIKDLENKLGPKANNL